MQQLDPKGLAEWLQDESREDPVLLDVREPWEYELCHIEGSQLMPMGSVPEQVNALEPEAEVVVICHHGIRSARVGMFLEGQGFGCIFNLSGGVAGWAEQVDPAMPQY